jgi:hypothetical protein
MSRIYAIDVLLPSRKQALLFPEGVCRTVGPGHSTICKATSSMQPSFSPFGVAIAYRQ